MSPRTEEAAAAPAFPATAPPRPPVLYITQRVPYPPDKGDRIRCFHLLEFLRGRADVHLACLADEPVPEAAVAALRERTARLAILPVGGALRWGRALWSLARGRTVSEGAFAVPALRRAVALWAGETRYHAALASASSLAPYLRHPALAGAARVIDLMDVDSQKWLDYAAARRGPKAWLYRLEGARLARLERDLAGWAKALTLVSEAEARLFRQSCPEAPVHAIKNGVDLDYFSPAGGEEEEEATCVFVGALDYFPNIDAAVWFCDAVWPEVLRGRPGAILRLVGRRPGSEVTALGRRPGVEVVGQVPDVRPQVRRATLSVVPLRIARGIQNKVLESLAMGKATVVSPQALAGVGARPAEHLAVAEAPAEWAAAILELFADRDRRRRLGAGGRAFVEEHHRWGRCLRPFADLLGLPL
jgi:sugar transferase (PEP-CTERM/EpsH1 system associated)